MKWGTDPRAALVVLLCLLSGAVSPALAQPQLEEPDGPSVSLIVSRFGGVLGRGAAEVASEDEIREDLDVRVLVANDGEAPVGDLEVVVVVHERVTTRSELRQALDRGRPQGFVAAVNPSVRDGAPLAPGDVAGVDVTVTGEDAGWIGEDGLYPVRIAVVRGTDVLDEVTTAVVHLDTAPAPALVDPRPAGSRGLVAAAVVWPLDAAPWRGPDGAYPPDVDAEIAPGGRLERLLAAVEGVAMPQVLLAPAAHLVEDLADRSDGFRERRGSELVEVPAESPAARRAANYLERLRAVLRASAHDPLASAYADADLPSLTAGGTVLADLAATALQEGRRRVRGLLGRHPDGASHLATGPTTQGVLDLVAAEHVLLPWEAVEGPEADGTTTLPAPVRTLRSSSGRRLAATVADPYVTALTATPATTHGDPVAVQRVLVETAMLHLQTPSLVRPLLVLPASDWRPDPQVAAGVVRALHRAPWVALTSPAELLVHVSGTPREATLAAPEFRLSPATGSALGRASRELAALNAALPSDVPTIGGRSADELATQLLRASSRELDEERRTALIDDVQEALDLAFGSVDVPDTAQVTLTSQRGALPVTVQRVDGGPLVVRVSVSSRGNLRWPERSKEVHLTGPGTQTLSFDTVALGRGTFAVTVEVTDATGTRLLDRATLSVRSTAISRPALVAIGTAVLLLLLWGFLRRRRAPQRPPLEVVRDG